MFEPGDHVVCKPESNRVKGYDYTYLVGKTARVGGKTMLQSGGVDFLHVIWDDPDLRGRCGGFHLEAFRPMGGPW